MKKDWRKAHSVPCAYCKGSGRVSRTGTKTQVIEKVLELRAKGFSLRKIASSVGVGNPQTVLNILKRKTCRECGKRADAPKEQQTRDYPICKICLSKGWKKATSKDILEDPELSKVVFHKINPQGT